MNEDVRWKQRYSNFSKALEQLREFSDKGSKLNKLEKQGLIKAFEYTFELAWNTIKDFYEYQGDSGIQGSRDAFMLAFNRGMIDDGESWMRMIIDRNLTSHVYNEDVADEISGKILGSYFGMFISLRDSLTKHMNNRMEN